MLSLKKLKENPIQISKKLTLESLQNLLEKACKQYYEESEPLISDTIYDILLEELESRDKDNSILKKIGYQSSSDKVLLPYFMGSMDKIKTKDHVKNWMSKYIDMKEKEKGFIITSKLDGISALYINDRDNVSLHTRGNGTYGRCINNIINNLDLPKFTSSKKIVVRGELIISKKNFQENGSNYNNCRGMVNGLVSLKENNPIQKNLDFVVFEVIEPKLVPNEQFKLIKKLGFKIPLLEYHSFNDIIKWENDESSFCMNKLKDYRKRSEYEMDGIIITHNEYYERIKGNPKNSVAFKCNHLGIVTTVQDVIWSASKYNVLIPRIKFDKIDLGSMVEYCTGFSAKYIFNNSIGPGSKIRVVLSGDVIPYIAEIISTTYPKMPNVNYEWNKTRIHIIALDDGDSLSKKKIVHFIKTLGIEYLSTGLINKLYSNGFNSIDKILRITTDELIKLEGFQETNSKKIFEAINKVISKPINLSVLMVASLKFNHGMGKKKINKIINKYPNLMEMKPSLDQIIAIEGFQEKTAKQFIDNLENFKEFLKTINVKYVINTNKDFEFNNKITGNHFVITGTRDSEILDIIKKYGGVLQNDINMKTDYLIVKDIESTSQKIKKAKIIGTKIINMEQFKSNYT